MKKEESKPKKKQPYVEPKVIVTYEKEELKETIKSQGKREESPMTQIDPPN